MARNNHIHNSFVAGEVSDKYLGRTDTQQYNQACRELKNMISFPQGGASKRPGTQFIVSITKDSGADVPDGARAFPYYRPNGDRWKIVLSTENVNSLAGDGWYCYKLTDAIGTTPERVRYGYGPGPDELETKMNAYYVFDQRQLDEIQFAQAGQYVYFAHPQFRPFRIYYYTPDDNFLMEPIGTSRMTTSPGVTNWQSIPFQARVFDIPSEGLVVTQIVNNSEYDITPSTNLATVSDAIYAQYVPNINWLGRRIKLSDGGTTMVLLITAVNVDANPNKVTGFIIGSNDGAETTITTNITYGSSANADSSFELEAWADHLYGWPKTVFFIDGRIGFGGNTAFPDYLWFSEINDITDFAVRKLEQDSTFADPVVATDPFEVSLKSDILNEIQWVSAGFNLTVGTNFGEFIVDGPDSSQSLGPTNTRSRQTAVYGSPYSQSEKIENSILFLQRSRDSVRELNYDFNENSFKAADLSILAEHISKKSIEIMEDNDETPNYSGGFKDIVMQKLPVPILWCLDVNGYLVGMTRDRIQDVVAWHRHEIAGGGKVISISVIQKPKPVLDTGITYGTELDELWLIVERTIDGDRALYLEKLSDPWIGSTIEKGWEFDPRGVRAPIYLDCAILADSTDYTDGVITGLPFSDGATVGVLCNGFWFGEYEVTAGEIDISDNLETPSEVFKAIIGFTYEADLVPVTPEVQAQLGTSMNLPRRVDQIMIHFYRTLGCKFGRKTSKEEENTPFYSLEEIQYPEGNTNDPPQLFTGIKTVNMPGGYERRPEILIRSHLPFPFTVTHITARLSVYE